MTRPALAAAACALALALAACGDDDSSSDGSDDGGTAAAQGTDLAAIKDYLLSHTEQLVGRQRRRARERRGLLPARQVGGLRLPARCWTSTAPRCAG